MKSFRFGLRAKLLLAVLLIQGVMLGFLVHNSLAVMETQLVRQAQLRVDEFRPLLNAALAGPMAAQDLGAIDEILHGVQRKEGLRYLQLVDLKGHVLAAAGMPLKAEPPPPDVSPAQARGDVFNTRMALEISGQPLGELRYGLSLGYLRETVSEARQQGLLIATVIVAISTLLLLATALWLSRRLQHLTEASSAIARGDYDSVRLPEGDDDIGQLSQAFRYMASALKQRIEEANASAEKFHAIADYTYDCEIWLSSEGRLLWVNSSVSRLTGYTPEECLAMPAFPITLIHADDRPEAEWRLRDALQGSTGEGFQFRLLHLDGSAVWAAANWQPIRNAAGQTLGVRASLRDITELKSIEQNMMMSLRLLKESESSAQLYLKEADQEQARLMALLSAMNLGILFVGADARVVYHNPAFDRIWLVPDGTELVGLPAREVFNHCDGIPEKPDEFAAHIEQVLASRESFETMEIAVCDGRLVTQHAYPVLDREGSFIGHLWVYEDVTQERRAAQQLMTLAERDSLTGLFNRHRFQEVLARAVDEAYRAGNACALLFFDLDEFKAINDHFGHGAGDALLTRVANEVSRVVRRHESLFRLGGDEFAIILSMSDLEQASALAHRVVNAISRLTLPYEGMSLRISSSLGIALYPEHAHDMEQLVAFADAAMYQAKQAGKNTWRAYRADLDATPEMLNRLTWNERLAEALLHDRFELHFQGVYSARTHQLQHLEALLRLPDETTGELIMPGLFIPLAEKSQKIVEIDRWVLGKVVQLLAERPAIPSVAVNLSGRSFDNPTIPGYIAGLLEQHSVDPRRLLIEITETEAVSDLTDAQRFIDAIRLTGCRVYLDDFGAGFASFAYLKHLQVDAIKIDGMFIRNLVQDHDNQVFVRGMVEVARGLGKETVAECVEDELALKLLASMGVDLVQGYYLDRPQARHPALTS
jgi:diguanylate cyclase (GGDEF)-like protein/PAS domain S-box-containing protein